MWSWTLALTCLLARSWADPVQQIRLTRDLMPLDHDLTRPDRIVGGEPVNRGELPWQVSIQMLAGSKGSHFCGGTLIEDSWVITAAHCTRDIDYDNVVVATGAWDLHEENTAYRVSKVIAGPYNTNTLQHDIALLKLDVKNPFSSTKRAENSAVPIAVEDQIEASIGKRCTISGWGRLSQSGSLPHILMAADVEIKSDDDCSSVFSERSFYSVFPTNVCAGGAERDACQGDSGGPLVCCDESTADLASCRLSGVTSWGIGCATRGIPGVYTEVAHYIDWIKTTIKEEDGNKVVKKISLFGGKKKIIGKI